jgi:hypothetical protein
MEGSIDLTGLLDNDYHIHGLGGCRGNNGSWGRARCSWPCRRVRRGDGRTAGERFSAIWEPVEVVASTDVYGVIAAAVGGDAVHVTSIINSPDADPHEYQSIPADALAVGKAALWSTTGPATTISHP